MVAWGLMFRTKEEVVWVDKSCVPNHSLCGLTSLMARVVTGHGLQRPFGEGIMSNGNEVEFRPFVLWQDGTNKETRTEEAHLGRENLKDYLWEKEVELREARKANKKDEAKKIFPKGLLDKRIWQEKNKVVNV
ncbi:hypothetical protein SUGI_1149720 [Cryptomeria japonica]|nr:hypothetical protein SUGI_1149720 [Cryptomeria japonica]